MDDEASRQDIGRGTEPKHWMLTCSGGSPGSCRAAPEQSLSLAAAQFLRFRYRVQGGEAKRLQSRCRYWMDAGERKVRRRGGRAAGRVGWVEV